MSSKKKSKSEPKSSKNKLTKNLKPSIVLDDSWNPIQLLPPAAVSKRVAPKLHVFGKDESHVCKTDSVGFARPGNRSPLEIVVDASNGFIPLWVKNMTLNWRFQEESMMVFSQPAAARAYIKSLMGDAVGLWGDACPVRMSESSQPWDFEVIMMPNDDCTANGCVLASAFFPNAGQNQLVLYPKLFEQSYEEQVETMAHEFGHIFGLRHFFAKVREQAWDSEIYGTHDKFSIMNYGRDSFMTETDITDLKNLYQEIWNGDRIDINGTPIKLFKPYSTRVAPDCVCS